MTRTLAWVPMVGASAVVMLEMVTDSRVHDLDRLAGCLSAAAVLAIGLGTMFLRERAPRSLAAVAASLCVGSVASFILVDPSNLRGFAGRHLGVSLPMASPVPMPATPLAIGIVVAVLCSSSLGIASSGTRRVAWWLMAAFASTVTAVLSTSATWGLIAGLVTLFPLSRVRRPSAAAVLAAALVGGVGAASLVISLANPSFQQRLVLWNDTVTRLSQRPATGLGFGVFPYVTPFDGITNAHNVVLQSWSDFGPTGVAAFVVVALEAWWRASLAVARGGSAERAWGRACFACLAAFIVVGGAESTIDMTFALGGGVFMTILSPFLFITAGFAPGSASGASLGARSG